jgi:putative Ca2+/H+ antiporter (TMEM165/GDT1 family)
LFSAFLISTGIVALAEVGDKTQLLALLLAARFRQPVPIIVGILIATLLNHTAAAALGGWLTQWLTPAVLRWLLGLGCIAMAAWMLHPDRLDAVDFGNARHGALLTTCVAFFLAEIGDKTQVATVALAARFQALTAVIAGTTCGMLLANVPAVLLGNRLATRLPVRLVHAVAAALFALLGLATLLGAGARFGF